MRFVPQSCRAWELTSLENDKPHSGNEREIWESWEIWSIRVDEPDSWRNWELTSLRIGDAEHFLFKFQIWTHIVKNDKFSFCFRVPIISWYIGMQNIFGIMDSKILTNHKSFLNICILLVQFLIELKQIPLETNKLMAENLNYLLYFK